MDAYTRSDNRHFIEAFKDAVHHPFPVQRINLRLPQKLSSAGKVFVNHCYAQSCDLLVDIPLENYNGILRSSFHAIPPDCHQYVKDNVEWDPRWGYNIFHTFEPSGPNSAMVSYQCSCYFVALAHM